MSRTLTWQFWERRTSSDQALSGVMPRRWASKPVAIPICCRRARASLSCAISASSCATREPPSRNSRTAPISVDYCCETMRHLDDVTSADTGRRPIGNPQDSVVLPQSWCRRKIGTAPQHVCSATGPRQRPDPRFDDHPYCDLPNRGRSQRVSLNELFTAIWRFVLVRSRPDATNG